MRRLRSNEKRGLSLVSFGLLNGDMPFDEVLDHALYVCRAVGLDWHSTDRSGRLANQRSLKVHLCRPVETVTPALPGSGVAIGPAVARRCVFACDSQGVSFAGDWRGAAQHYGKARRYLSP